MRRRRRGPGDLDRVPIGALVAAIGDKLGVFVQDYWGTLPGILLTIAFLLAWMAWNVWGPPAWRFDPAPFFKLNLLMSAGATITVPLWVMGDRVKNRRAAAELRETIREELHRKAPP